jgi:uncharacterized protein (TIGR00645 family)
MTEQPRLEIAGIEARIRRNVGRMMFVTRWVMAPIYLGLVAVLLLLAIKFVQKLVETVPQVLRLDTSDTILAALMLVDIALVANLVVIVMFAGWDNFVGRLLRHSGEAESDWIGKLDFSSLKLRLFASIAAIAAIQLLETFTHISSVAKQDAAWQLAILLGVGVTGVLLAVIDRISEGKLNGP